MKVDYDNFKSFTLTPESNLDSALLNKLVNKCVYKRRHLRVSGYQKTANLHIINVSIALSRKGKVK